MYTYIYIYIYIYVSYIYCGLRSIPQFRDIGRFGPQALQKVGYDSGCICRYAVFHRHVCNGV